jgi:hypothetical protein
MFRTRSRIPAAAAAIATATAIAACGSASPTSPTSSSSSGSGGPPSPAQLAQAQHDMVRFATCLRSHGVPNVPDPTNPRQFKTFLGGNQAPAVLTAETACQHLLPGGGPPNHNATHSRAQITAALAFARCLRSHGFPNFPDPTSTGDLSHQMLAAAGINLQQPAVAQAADACVGVTHGLITRAGVAKFIAGH